MEAICKKCQILFSGKNKKKYFNMLRVKNKSGMHLLFAVYLSENSFNQEV